MNTTPERSWRPAQQAERAKARRAQPAPMARRTRGLRERQAAGGGARRLRAR